MKKSASGSMVFNFSKYFLYCWTRKVLKYTVDTFYIYIYEYIYIYIYIYIIYNEYIYLYIYIPLDFLIS